jgi:hypothetical protein
MVSEYLKQNTAEFHDAAEKLFNLKNIRQNFHAGRL